MVDDYEYEQPKYDFQENPSAWTKVPGTSKMVLNPFKMFWEFWKDQLADQAEYTKEGNGETLRLLVVTDGKRVTAYPID